MIEPQKLLANIPSGLRDPLIAEYRGITSAYAEGRWKLSALDGGRFCEVVYTILDGALAGTFPHAPTKPARFPEACRALENRPPIIVGDRSLRILIPRVLPGVYEIRNNRNVGHVGGDVVPNRMDASFVRDVATWVMAELVRVFHATSVGEAQDSVDALTERRHPLIWEKDGIKRVLAPDMKAGDRVLILLHSTPGWCAIAELQSWAKYQRNFKAQVLEPAADKLLLEIDAPGERVTITPLGVAYVEGKLAKIA